MEDVSVGPQPEQYLHTTSGGVQDGPPLVLCPGYGAGTGFFFRCASCGWHLSACQQPITLCVLDHGALHVLGISAHYWSEAREEAVALAQPIGTSRGGACIPQHAVAAHA